MRTVSRCMAFGGSAPRPRGRRELGINFTMEYNLISLAGRALSFEKLFARPVTGGGRNTRVAFFSGADFAQTGTGV